MESQRVKILTDGYLRGWLSFEYSLPTSRLREEMILSHLELDRLYELLQHKLFIETTIRSNLRANKPDIFDPIFNVSNSLIGLKLPLLRPKDKIKDDSKLTKTDLVAWKDFLEKVNKK